MGVSNRTTHAIEPGTGDLLMPDRVRNPRADRTRDIEDACFESVIAPRDVFSMRSCGSDAGGVFKSRIAHPQADGPIPSDFVRTDHAFRQTMAQSGRLGVFAGRKTIFAAGGPRSSMAAPALVLAVFAVVAVSFWMVRVDALVVQPAVRLQATSTSSPLIPIIDQATLSPDPVMTSSVPVKKPGASKEGFSSPAPRPARIERAGSILMIRPGGD